MKYGMNMLLWSNDVSGDEMVPVFERIKAMGYDGVEIPIFNPEPRAFARLAQTLDGFGLARTAITVRSAEHNPISPDAAVRKHGVDQMKRVLECCKVLGADLLAGPNYAALGVFSGRGPTPDEWKRGVDSVRLMAEDAGKVGVTLALEPLNRFETYLLNSAKDATRFVADVGHPRCRMMYDTFHAHIEEKDIESAIESCARVMAHVHISENDRSTPGKGQIDWRRTFATLKNVGYDGWLTIEAFGTRLTALAAATCIWRRMFDNEDQVAREGLRFMKRNWEGRKSRAVPLAPGASA